MFDAIRQDLRHAIRTLSASAGFTAAAVLTLGLGVGATTAIFSIVDAVILRPLAYREPSQLYAVHELRAVPVNGSANVPVNAAHFHEWRRAARSFEEMALLYPLSVTLTGSGEPQQIAAARVSASLFPMLGLQAQLGRTFLDDEDERGRDHVVVVTHDLWTRQFGADPHVVGRAVRLNGETHTIVGVLAPGATIPKITHLYQLPVTLGRNPDVFKPFAVREDELGPSSSFNFACIVRVRPGVSEAQATAELETLQTEIARTMTGGVRWGVKLVSLHDQITGRARLGLQLLLVTVGLVLLVGCINVTNLLLSRGMHRRRELAIRQAAGATRARLVQQALVEGSVLALAGGALGVGVAFIGLRLLLATAPIDVPRIEDVSLDGRVLMFALGTSLLGGLIVSWLPAWRFAREDPADLLRTTGHSSTATPSGLRARSTLVALEIAVSTGCVVLAGLLLASMANVLRVERGFDTERVMTIDVALPRMPADPVAGVQRLDDLVARARAIPGVVSAGASDRVPLGGTGGNTPMHVEGGNVPALERPVVSMQVAGTGYFQTLGIRLLSGRAFEDRDRQQPMVAVISETAARRGWPGQDAVGKRFRIGPETSPSPVIEVVGVVADVRGEGLDRDPRLQVYVPLAGFARVMTRASIAVRTTLPPSAVAPALRRMVQERDPELAVSALRTMDAVVSESVAPRRFQLTVILVFAAMALLLAAIGVYGTMSYAVTQRTREIGIRVALGALPGTVRTLVLRQSMRPALWGTIAGIAVSMMFGRVISSLLFGVSPTNPLIAAAAAACLGTVALAASYLPARRATRINPLLAIRSDD